MGALKRFFARFRRLRQCPHCESPYFKAIFAGLPLKMCANEECCCAWGPGSTAMNWFSNGEGWALAVYKGSYLRALWDWVFHPHKWHA